MLYENIGMMTRNNFFTRFSCAVLNWLVIITVGAFSVVAHSDVLKEENVQKENVFKDNLQEEKSLLPESIYKLLYENDAEVNVDGLMSAYRKEISRMEHSGVARDTLAYATGIADKAIQQEREGVLNYLGLSDKNARVYIFLSFSMADSLIKAYVREAMWSGAIIVFRGIDEESTLKEFLTSSLMKLVGSKGSSATIQIDPRLFDAFSVTAVPTIVYTEMASLALCNQSHRVQFGPKPNEIYQPCAAMDENEYWKLSGAVTLGWALEQFYDAGVLGAAKIMSTLSDNIGGDVDQKQTAFVGEWDTLPTPAHEQAVYEQLKHFGTIYETPRGLAVGPEGLEDSTSGIYKFD